MLYRIAGYLCGQIEIYADFAPGPNALKLGTAQINFVRPTRGIDHGQLL